MTAAPANLEEKTVKHDPISLRRRHLMIAGAITIAAPAAAFAGQSIYATDAGAATLVISGRVLGPDGKPLAGAAVDANNLPGVSATTDADGRFMFTTVAGTVRNGRPQPLTCRVNHPAHRTLENTLEFGHASIQRDEAGGWRAAFGLHLA
jgi:protocatechuate 3,4-dioxygenase beta subunit